MFTDRMEPGTHRNARPDGAERADIRLANRGCLANIGIPADRTPEHTRIVADRHLWVYRARVMGPGIAAEMHAAIAAPRVCCASCPTLELGNDEQPQERSEWPDHSARNRVRRTMWHGGSHRSAASGALKSWLTRSLSTCGVNS